VHIIKNNACRVRCLNTKTESPWIIVSSGISYYGIIILKCYSDLKLKYQNIREQWLIEIFIGLVSCSSFYVGLNVYQKERRAAMVLLLVAYKVW
jgi:hypothetical protein